MTRLRPVHSEELPELLRMRTRAEQWLAGRGSDQFQNPQAQKRARQDIKRLLRDGRFVGLTSNGHDLLAVNALVEPDLDFWGNGDDLAASWFMARGMVTSLGSGHMAELFDHLSSAAAGAGKTWLRFDCWRTNTALHDYYKTLGFHHVRTVNIPGRDSGALFQRACPTLPTSWDHQLLEQYHSDRSYLKL